MDQPFFEWNPNKKKLDLTGEQASRRNAQRPTRCARQQKRAPAGVRLEVYFEGMQASESERWCFLAKKKQSGDPTNGHRDKKRPPLQGNPVNSCLLVALIFQSVYQMQLLYVIV